MVSRVLVVTATSAQEQKNCTRHVEEQSQSQRCVCEQLSEGLCQEPLLTNHGYANQAVAQRLQKSIHASASTSGAPEHGILEAGSQCTTRTSKWKHASGRAQAGVCKGENCMRPFESSQSDHPTSKVQRLT